MLIDNRNRLHGDNGEYLPNRDRDIYLRGRESGRAYGFRQCAEIVARKFRMSVRQLFQIIYAPSHGAVRPRMGKTG